MATRSYTYKLASSYADFYPTFSNLNRIIFEEVFNQVTEQVNYEVYSQLYGELQLKINHQVRKAVGDKVIDGLK